MAILLAVPSDPLVHHYAFSYYNTTNEYFTTSIAVSTHKFGELPRTVCVLQGDPAVGKSP